MKPQLTISTECGKLQFSGGLDVYGADAARAELLAALASQPDVTLDLSGVSVCDASGLQVLIAMRKAAALAGKPFDVQAPAPAILECADLLGVSPANWQEGVPIQ